MLKLLLVVTALIFILVIGRFLIDFLFIISYCNTDTPPHSSAYMSVNYYPPNSTESIGQYNITIKETNLLNHSHLQNIHQVSTYLLNVSNSTYLSIVGSESFDLYYQFNTLNMTGKVNELNSSEFIIITSQPLYIHFEISEDPAPCTCFTTYMWELDVSEAMTHDFINFYKGTLCVD